MQPFISIIIPVYNGGLYLKRCIDSALAQDYSKLEILVIDDGSTDNTSAILQPYSDQRLLRVLHQPHSGVSAARNAGVGAAWGDLIAFLDADDWIAPDYITVLSGLLEAYHADISACGMQKTTCFCRPSNTKTVRAICFNHIAALREMLYQSAFDTSLAGKLIPKELLLRHPCPEGHLYEDFFTMYRILEDCGSVAYCRNRLYYYFQHNHSIMHRIASRNSLDQWDAAQEVFQFVQYKHPNLLGAAVSKQFSVASSMLAKFHEASAEKAGYEPFWEYICENRWRVLFDSRVRMKNRLAAFCSIWGQSFFLFAYRKYTQHPHIDCCIEMDGM